MRFQNPSLDVWLADEARFASGQACNLATDETAQLLPQLVQVNGGWTDLVSLAQSADAQLNPLMRPVERRNPLADRRRYHEDPGNKRAKKEISEQGGKYKK